MKTAITICTIVVLIFVAIIGYTIYAKYGKGNFQFGIDSRWNFNWAIIQLGNGELIEGEITNWRDFSNSDTVQVTLDNEITFLSHYSNIILCSKEP